MEDNDLISIIVPVYKVEAYLPKCMDSLLSQTYEHFEVLLIDDGSPDNCPAICDRYAAQDARVRVFHKQNGGQSSARNLGLDNAKGDYIAFVDSDDYVSPLFLERLYQSLVEDHADFSVCDYQKIDENDNIIEKKMIQINGETDQDGVWRWETEGLYMFAAALWNKLFKAELWKELRLKNGKYAEDSFAFTQYMKHVRTVSVIPEPLYFYFQRADSNVHNYSVKNLDSVEAKLERAAYHLDSGKEDLARAVIMKIAHQLFYASGQLDLTDPVSRLRYTQLLNDYKVLYRRAGCRLNFSKEGIKNALIKMDRVSAAMWNIYHSVKRK